MLARYNSRRYFAGATAARIGDEMSGPALLLLGLSVLGSAGQASVVYAGLTIAAALGGPFFGIVLDRAARPGRLLGGALVAYAGGLAVVSALLGHVGLALVVAVAGVTGLLAPALTGGWTAQLANVIPAGNLARGHALDAATFNLAGLVGPALAAIVATIWGAGWALAAAIVMLVLAAPCAWQLPAALSPRHNTDLAGTTVFRQLRAGFGAIWHIVALRRITAASSVAYAGLAMFVIACPLLGRAYFGSASSGALLLSVLAAGSLLATAVMARWPALLHPETTFVWATALAGTALVLLGLSSTPWAIVAAVTLLGIADGPQLAALLAIRQREAPPHLRSQIFTTGPSLKITAGALGAASAGALSTTSVTVVLIAAAATQLGALVTYVVTGAGQRQFQPAQTA